jgi:hypothetical protein
MLGEDLRLSIALAAQPRVMRSSRKSIGNPAAASKVFLAHRRVARSTIGSQPHTHKRTHNSGESQTPTKVGWHRG